MSDVSREARLKEPWPGFEERVQSCTAQLCAFDPAAAEYPARTEAWVRLVLTIDDELRGLGFVPLGENGEDTIRRAILGQPDLTTPALAALDALLALVKQQEKVIEAAPDHDCRLRIVPSPNAVPYCALCAALAALSGGSDEQETQ